MSNQTGEWPVPSEEDLLLLARETDTASADRVASDRALAAIAKETWVFARPSWSSQKLGYLRGGALVTRSAKPLGHAGCDGGWYRIAPEGFVCIGQSATLDLEHPVVVAAKTRANRELPLPYRYGTSRFPTPPLYAKAPSPSEQQRVEPELDSERRGKSQAAWADVAIEPLPLPLQTAGALAYSNAERHAPGAIYNGRALAKSAFAFLSFFEIGGRKFGLSADLDLMPLDRLQPVQASKFGGLALDGEVTLPVVFVNAKGKSLYAGDPKKGLGVVRALGFREALAVSGRRVQALGQIYLETRQGEWLRDENLIYVPRMQTRPGWVAPGRTWLDISILKQTLVAYEGTTPVYVTLVSTGADSLGDPKETHSTVRGQFLIHTKHVTATMSGDEVGDEFDLRDVPYVMYFSEGYALHAAYWHDSFGQPHSHGCINLSPIDARWIFEWTDPPVPEGWHGAMSLRDGTLVHVHP